jgi:hypothetical protein
VVKKKFTDIDYQDESRRKVDQSLAVQKSTDNGMKSPLGNCDICFVQDYLLIFESN